MQTFIAIFSLINQLLPLIRKTVLTLEELFPQSGTGSAKKAMLNEILDKTIAATGVAGDVYAAAKPVISVVIDAVAGLHKSPAVAGAPAPAVQP